MQEKIALVEGEEEEENMEEIPAVETEIEEADNGEISLHAIRGLANNKIIKVEGKVCNHKLMVLIDSGSTQFLEGEYNQETRL